MLMPPPLIFAKPVLTIVLCDLITGRLVLVEVMLSIKATDWLDLTVQGDRGTKGWKERGDLEFLCRMSQPLLPLQNESYEPAGSPEKQDQTRRH